MNEERVSFPTGAFAGNFDRLLGVHRLSAADASKLLGISATTLSYWRTGKREPTVQSLARVCDFFEVDWSVLLMAPAGEFVESVLGNRRRFELVERRIRGEVARGDEPPGALRREAEHHALFIHPETGQEKWFRRDDRGEWQELVSDTGDAAADDRDKAREVRKLRPVEDE